jgi:hypothetical protein
MKRDGGGHTDKNADSHSHGDGSGFTIQADEAVMKFFNSFF